MDSYRENNERGGRRRLWFVTPVTNADMRVAGPYETCEEAEQECLRRLDRLTAIRALMGGRIPVYYIPRLFEVTISGASFISTGPPPRLPQRRAIPRHPVDLPRVVYSYSRRDLLVLCQGLGLPVPPDNASRDAILEHIEHELAKLAGRHT